MFKSTCNIVLTTDICPNAIIESNNNNNSQHDGCTTHTYTFSPDQCKVFHEISQPRPKTEERIIVSRDVSCQTSDCEVIPKKKNVVDNQQSRNRSTSAEGRRKAYSGHRRATDSILSSNSVQQTEGYRLTPSRSPRQASPAISNPSAHSSRDRKKPPRTVHIDVYCTGSDADTNSTNSSSPNIVDDIANLMTQAQTVIDADDMILKHKRIVSRSDLPRKLMKEPKSTQIEITEPDDDNQRPQNLFDFSQVLLQSSSNDKEEVNESKQMLFKKYLGDQRQIQKFNELKALMMRRQTSDDAMSSNYPNSSYSTVRDLTSSSLASAVANSPTIKNFEENEWKELDVAIQSGDFITPVGNFQSWDKTDDFEKMKDFKRLWREPSGDLLRQRQIMENFMFNPPLHHKEHSEPSESDSFNFIKSNELGNISDSSPSTVISYSHKKQASDTIPITVPKVIKEVDRKSVEASTVSSSLKSGTYSKDHLSLAKRFGSVLKSLRKPGHHVGPIKNPSCLCETCKRWVLERDQVQGRERAYSFGETPITQTSFWRNNNRYYV